MKKIKLIVEKNGNRYFGRTTYDDNLIVADEKNLGKLEETMKRLLMDFHGINTDDILFKHSYDLTSLFEKFNYLKVSTVAEFAGVNASLLRQYVIGSKQASPAQAKKIEGAIHKIGKELQNTQVYAPEKVSS